MTDSERRLTSWKEIASHMGRDVRTVMRWEKLRALPIHRGSDDRGGVVFADMDELDAWVRGDKPTPEAAGPGAAPSVPATRQATRRWNMAAAAVLTLAVGLGGWRLSVSAANAQPDSVVMTDGAVIARDADGSEKWRHEFVGETSGPPFARLTNPTEPLAGGGWLAATSGTVRKDTRAVRSGRVMWFDPAGNLRRSFSFEDRLQMGTRDYSAPWSISDYQVDSRHGTRRIAVAANHFDWWPSIVTVLDGQWQRKGSFVHAGWVEHLRWLADDRLAVAGFSNLKNGGMVALLDANALNGQSPSPPDSEFECTACGPDRPVRYVVMPRSEVNRVSAAPFNRASLFARGSTLLVPTLELPQTPTTTPAEALYEFTPQLELLHASYSDRYWEAHRELERVGKIHHTRAQCPDRDGPRQIEIWEPATGWRVQLTSRQ